MHKGSSANNKIYLSLKIITTVLIIIPIIYIFLMLGIRLFGINTYPVLSGSMEPAYKVGSVVYVADADKNELSKGDAITFKMSGGTIVTHRIIEIVNNGDEVLYRTQGDANDTPDGTLVSYDDIIGKVAFNIPYLGYVSVNIKKAPGIYILIAYVAVTIFLEYICDEMKKDKKNKEDDDKKQQNNVDKL